LGFLLFFFKKEKGVLGFLLFFFLVDSL